jgi:hypothetical protein
MLDTPASTSIGIKASVPPKVRAASYPTKNIGNNEVFLKMFEQLTT